MSRHEGVSCDSCLKGNFRGRRFKCLICYDYDLCAACYESGAATATTRHAAEHPMQCILTRTDSELYYAGEALSTEQPQAFTCPYCGKMGHTEASLQDHVTSDHAETAQEVICPICASLPGGDPNLVTDDFGGHLTLEHRNGQRDLISFLDEPATAGRHGMRRIPHPSRGVGSRPRRSNMHFSSSGGLSPSSRESVDPIAELLTQLSGVRRSAGQGSTPTLQQLQMQLQLERQQVRAARQQLERLPRRQTQASAAAAAATCSTAAPVAVPVQDTPTQSQPAQSQFLLSRIMEEHMSEGDLAAWEQERADRSLFVQELFLSTLAGIEALSTPSSEPLFIQSNTRSSDELGRNFNSEDLMRKDELQAQSSGYGNPSSQCNQIEEEPNDSDLNLVNMSSSTTSMKSNNQSSVSSNKRVNRSVTNSRTQPSPPHQGSGAEIRGVASVRGILAPQQVRHITGIVPPIGRTNPRPSVRKPVRPVEGRNQATEPPPPH